MQPPALPSRRRSAAPLVAAVALVVGAAGAVLVVALWSSSGSALRAPEAAAPTATAAPAVVPPPAGAAGNAATAVDAAADPGAVRSSALASADVEVRVVDEADRPVEGATVRLGATMGSQAEPESTALTDAGGRAVLHAVRQGVWFASASHAELMYAP